MRPAKYSEFHHFVDVEEHHFQSGIYIREMFDSGIAIVHAHYMVEMSFRHPVMYFLFYRWWVLWFLHENQRKYIGAPLIIPFYASYSPRQASFSGNRHFFPKKQHFSSRQCPK